MGPFIPKQKFFTKWWEKLIGDTASFSMENRLFNAISVFTLAALVFALISNTVLGISSLYIIMTALLQCVLYYYSRFKKRFGVPAIIYCFATYSYFIMNYFYNAGIEGPTLMGFISSFMLIVALGPLAWHRFWVVLHIAVVSCLVLLEYFHIGRYEQYANRQDHFMDMGVSYLISLTIMYFVIVHIRNNYMKEKHLAEQYAASILKKNEELEELNQVKSRLFSIISHDLRSPLNSVQGYLELLTDGSFSESEKSNIQQQLLNLTKHTQDMLFNLLSWSKSQISGNVVELHSVNVSRTLAGTIEILQSAANKKNIKLISYVDPTVQINADADMLQLIVRNLIHNAIKFTGTNGEISIKTYKNGKQVCISVKDNGIGIPVDKQASIFSSKLKSAQGTNKETGIGLGLYLCRELAELQNGKIWFTSQPGQGSEFVFAVPEG
jgi:signal transduction histidine kinase